MSPLKKDKLPVPMTPDTDGHLGDRRNEHRNRLEGVLRVSVSVPPGDEVVEAVVLDVTETGVGLHTVEPMRRGVIVTFVCGEQRIYGVVEYCRPNGTNYRLGIAIKDAVDN
jgi:hypothetical protein